MNRLIHYTYPRGTSLLPALANRSLWTGLESEIDRLFATALADFPAPGQVAQLPVDLTPRGAPDALPADGAALLVEGLVDAVHAPLGPVAGGATLAGLTRQDRLDELSFDLRLGGSGPSPTLRGIGAVVATHLPDDDPLRGWAEDLASGGVDVELSGFLTGSIDLVARVGPPDGRRFVVADYKTNQLTARGAPPTPADYAQPSLVAAMVQHDYPLQALL